MQTRHLAIMLTDIQGFTSKTAGFSRAETMELLKKHKELVMPVVDKFHGRLIKAIGDAFLVTFESPTDAVICGVDIQNVLKNHNAGKEQHEKIEIRIAINSGEVALQDDGDIYGDAVNITSRLESIAEVGQVFFTEAVYLAMNKKEVPSSEIGYRQFRGVPEKIKVYRVLREIPVGEQESLVAEVPGQPGPGKEEIKTGPASGAAAPQGLETKADAPPIRAARSGGREVFKKRLWAFAIDLFIVLIFPVKYKVFIWLLYNWFFIWKFGATPGKMILKIKVIDATSEGKPDLKISALRAVCSVLSMFPVFLGYLWALREEEGRTWHDLLAQTRVIKA